VTFVGADDSVFGAELGVALRGIAFGAFVFVAYASRFIVAT
jgi:hypothetical protein